MAILFQTGTTALKYPASNAKRAGVAGASCSNQG
jgi:hypothetical protein